jgi:hypothetical protein
MDLVIILQTRQIGVNPNIPNVGTTMVMSRFTVISRADGTATDRGWESRSSPGFLFLVGRLVGWLVEDCPSADGWEIISSAGKFLNGLRSSLKPVNIEIHQSPVYAGTIRSEMCRNQVSIHHRTVH